jgi:thioesterase domain-containing protein
MIALEMAQQLRALGRDIPLLVVLDGELFNTGAEISVFNPIYWIKLVLNSPRWVRDVLLEEFTFRTFLKALPRNIIAKAKSAIAGLAGKRPDDAVEAMIDIRNLTPDHAAFVKALYESQFNYTPKKYDDRVVVCVAKTQPLAYHLQVEATWRKIAPAADVAKFKGTHASLVFPADGAAVARYLTSVLSEIIDQPNSQPRERKYAGLRRAG